MTSAAQRADVDALCEFYERLLRGGPHCAWGARFLARRTTRIPGLDRHAQALVEIGARVGWLAMSDGIRFVCYLPSSVGDSSVPIGPA